MQRRIKRADVQELLKNVAPVTNLGTASDAVKQMQEAEATFLSKVRFVLDELEAPNPVTSGDPAALADDLDRMELAAAEVAVKVKNILQHYKVDTDSHKLYEAEKARWDVVAHLVEVAINFAKGKIPYPEAITWVSLEQQITAFIDRHSTYGALKPDRNKTITVASGDTVVGVPKGKNKTQQIESDRRKRQKELVMLVVEAAKLIATATADSLDNYTDAGRNLKEAKGIIESLGQKPTPTAPEPPKELEAGNNSGATQVLRKKGQYIKFAGCVYKAVD